jgi:hypothetical protein
MSDKITLEQAQALIGAEIVAKLYDSDIARGPVKRAYIDRDGDVALELHEGYTTWPGLGGYTYEVITPAPAPAPAPASANETPAARVARLRAELELKQSDLELAQIELDRVSPAFPEGWSMRDGAARGSDDELIRVSRCPGMLLIVDSDNDEVEISLAAMRAFLARLG